MQWGCVGETGLGWVCGDGPCPPEKQFANHSLEKAGVNWTSVHTLGITGRVFREVSLSVHILSPGVPEGSCAC